MDEKELIRLDNEFKRYLQILRPYLITLVEEDVIECCGAWIERLTRCEVSEKQTRNQYVFALCYQLSKGVLDEPFVCKPPEGDLIPYSMDDISEDSVATDPWLGLGCPVETLRGSNDTDLWINPLEGTYSETEQCDSCSIPEEHSSTNKKTDNSGRTKRVTIMPSPCQRQRAGCTPGPSNTITESTDTVYEHRANNLISKLREIKKQNMLLNSELFALKEEASRKETACPCPLSSARSMSDDHIVQNRPLPHQDSENGGLIISHLKRRLLDMQSSRNFLVEAVKSLEGRLKGVEAERAQELEDLAIKFKLDLAEARICMNKDVVHAKNEYADKMEQLDMLCNLKIKDIEEKSAKELAEISEIHKAALKEKDEAIKVKDEEIARLEEVIQEQCANLQSAVSRFVEKCTEGTSEALRARADQLERQLSRLERTRARCARAYELRLANVRREKHLMECTMQLQLLRQRAQLTGESTEESQAELAAAVNKLEAKYKDIVASIQAAAIKRRLQDHLNMEAIIQSNYCTLPTQAQQTCLQPLLHSPNSTSQRHLISSPESKCVAVLVSQQPTSQIYQESWSYAAHNEKIKHETLNSPQKYFQECGDSYEKDLDALYPQKDMGDESAK